MDIPAEAYDGTARQRALALIPKVTGSLSMAGSSWIIVEVLSDRKKQGRVYHRLLLAMSASDVLASFFYFLSTWCVPVGTKNTWGAAGNRATCNLQGFMLQLHLVTPLYNVFLSWYYLLLLRYNWTESRIERKAEPWMHAIAILLGLGTAVAALLLDLYNPVLWCWIAPAPPRCEESYANDGATTCLRGDNATLYAWVFFYIWVWIGILFASACMYFVYKTVLGQEKRIDRYSKHVERSVRRRHSRRIKRNAYGYIGAFFATWLFPTIGEVQQVATGGRNVHYAVSVLVTICLPLQGFLNWLVYMRPRYDKYTRDHPDWSVLHTVRQVLCRTFECRKEHDDHDDDHNFSVVDELVDETPQDDDAEEEGEAAGGGGTATIELVVPTVPAEKRDAGTRSPREGAMEQSRESTTASHSTTNGNGHAAP